MDLKLIRLIATLEEAEQNLPPLHPESQERWITAWREEFENLIDGHSGWTFDAFYNVPLRDDNVVVHFFNTKTAEDYWVHIHTGDDNIYTEMKWGDYSDPASLIMDIAKNRIFERA